MSTTSSGLRAEEEWKIAWIADHLGWQAEYERLGRSRIFKFPGGQKVYLENRNRGQANRYWIRIFVRNYKAIENDAGFAHVLFIDNAARAIILPEATIRALIDFITSLGRPSLNLYVYPGFRVQGDNSYGDNWASFVTDVDLISDSLRLRRAALAFPVPIQPPRGQETVAASIEQVRRFKRSISVARWVLHQAAGKCEACLRDAPFSDEEGYPFLEVHHLRALAEGGPDTINNAIAVCPNCHRELHYGQNSDRLRDELARRIGRLKDVSRDRKSERREVRIRRR